MQRKQFRLSWWSVILVYTLYISECASTARIQRRFMWKQMDNTMDDLLDSMASGARAMKNMFDELIPGMTTSPTPLLMHSSNVLDYLPSETTKVKYIIRNPSTHKPLKIIKMAAPKKVVKIMTVPKPIVENKLGKSKFNFPNAEAMRQLEREQEMLVEEHQPQFSAESLKSNDIDVVKGQISEIGTDWLPVSTAKPLPMSELHTKIVAEELPEPEKIIYEPQANEVSYEYHKKKPHYEVTEHTPEESVAVPITHTHYQNSRGFVPIKNTQHHHRNQQSNYQQNARVGLHLTSTASTITTSTSESPNYPAAFLKKQQRERPLSLLQQHLKNVGVNESAKGLAISKPKPAQKIPNLERIKSESWPLLGPTIPIPTIAVQITSTAKVRKAEPLVQPTSEERLRQKTTRKPATARPHDIRQRGSIKFGDKLTELY